VLELGDASRAENDLGLELRDAGFGFGSGGAGDVELGDSGRGVIVRLRRLARPGLELGLELVDARGRTGGHVRNLRGVGLRRLVQPGLHAGLELGDPGGRGFGDASYLGSVSGRRPVRPGLDPVRLLGEGIPLGDDGAQGRLELLDPRVAVDGLRNVPGHGCFGRHGVQAGADAELGLEQAAVLLGECVRDRAGGDEAELDEERAERPLGPSLLGERLRQLLEGQKTLVDHELA
jgi:hypothetical protein